MRIITVAAFIILAVGSGAQAVENDYPRVTVGSARFPGPPDAQGHITMYVPISATSCSSMASGSFEPQYAAR